jgi:hypothetical protein
VCRNLKLEETEFDRRVFFLDKSAIKYNVGSHEIE